MYPYSRGVVAYRLQPEDSFWNLSQKFNISVDELSELNPDVDPDNLFVGQIIRIPDPSRKIIPWSTTPSTQPYCITRAEVELKSRNRVLWEQHISWTRMTIISLVFKLPDIDEVLARLLQNATDMGNSIKPYYGNRIGARYGQLVREHLVIAADLVKAAIAGDQKAVADFNKKWYRNADEIAVFWHQINPYLSEETVRKMFYEHLDLTKTEAVSMIQKDFKKDVAVFDDIETEALEMSDALSDGIIRQFPGKFSMNTSPRPNDY